MSKFVIEKDVPFTVFKDSFPFEAMEVGDSFFVPSHHNLTTTRAYAYRVSKKLGRKFVTRSVKGGVRIWRVE